MLATNRSPTLNRNAVDGPAQPKNGLIRRFEPLNPRFKSARLSEIAKNPHGWAQCGLALGYNSDR